MGTLPRSAADIEKGNEIRAKENNRVIGPDMKPAVPPPLHIANHKYNQTFLFSDQSTIGNDE